MANNLGLGEELHYRTVRRTYLVTYWVCSIEEHEDGGKHYHMALKLSEQKDGEGLKIFCAISTK